MTAVGWVVWLVLLWFGVALVAFVLFWFGFGLFGLACCFSGDVFDSRACYE